MSQLPFFKYDEIFTDPVRLLVKESHAIFSTIPRHAHLSKSEAIKISRNYRSVIRECVENLSQGIRCDYADQIETFKELDVMWNLCEILLLDISQTGTQIIQLRNWANMHFDQLDQNSKEVMRSLEANEYQLNKDDASVAYWSLLVKLVLRGDTRKAVQLLAAHYDFAQNDQLQIVASMLDSMPLSNQYISQEFQNKWAAWSSWCARERETGQFNSDPYLLTIVRLLSQDSSIYDELASQCGSWQQLMVAYLIYMDPCIKDTELPELCRTMLMKSRTNNPNQSHLTSEQLELDEIIIAIFEYDLVRIITLCCSYLNDNWWFVTHFIDLLHCCDQLKAHEIVESDKLRESFLQDYATTLFDNEQLWPLGVSYLDNCPVSGLYYLESLLSRIEPSINDEGKAHKIERIARKRGLTDLAKSIRVLMARSWLAGAPRLDEKSISHKFRETNDDKMAPHAFALSNALYWAIRSGDTSLVTHISDQCLYYYCKTGNFPDRTIFECLIKRSPIDNDRLTFLAKYYQFKQLNIEVDEDSEEAANLLRSLLLSQVYPKFFCKELLDDAHDLLYVRPQLVFTPEQTQDILKTIEDITRVTGINDDKELRKMLVRNMAKSLINPIRTEN